MRDRKVATRYAGALLASAKEQGVLEGVAESYITILDAVEGNARLGSSWTARRWPPRKRKIW